MSPAQSRNQSRMNFWVVTIGLGLMGYFTKPPYCYLILLGAIFVICWEISERLREQYYLHQANQELLRRISEQLERHD